MFAIASKQGQGMTVVTGELVVDQAGFVVSQTLGPPLDLTFTRRP